MIDQFSRRSTLGLLGAAMAGAGPSGQPSHVDAVTPAIGVHGLDVRAYGAVADDRTDNSPAFEAAIAAAIAAGRPIFIPAATKAYAVSRPIRPATGIIGEGRGSVVRALSAEAFRGGRAIVHIGWRRAENPALCTVPVHGFRVMGAGSRPARRSSDPQAIGFEGIGILFDETAAFIHMIDVGAEFCRKGIVHGTRNGHIGGTNVFCANNWYNLYWERNGGDYRYVDCVFTGALFATYGCHGSRRDDENVGGISSLTVIGCHGGFSPYLFFQEDGDGSVGLLGWTSINSSCEQIGNQVIRLGRTPKGGRRVSAGWFVVTPGHSWTIAGSAEHAAYAIDGEPAVPVQRYAIDVDLIQGAAVEIHGTGWVGGKSGCHTRIVDLLAWVADDNGIGGYEVTGGGAERLTYASAPRLRQPHRVESRNLRGGAVHEIARFDIPPYYDNTQGGELMWSLAYAARVPRSIGLRFIVQIDGKGTIAAQVLTPQYLSGEVGNLNGRADIGIGRRDPKRGHGVRLLVEIPNGVEIAALTGSLALVIGQDTGIVG
jgi:hypothetical protein